MNGNGDKRSVSEEVELTGAQIVKKLRAAAHPAGQKGNWMKHLSDKQLSEVYHRLKLGQNAVHIAKIAQSQWGLMQGSESRSIARSIRKFGKKVLGEMQLAKLDAKQEAKQIESDMRKAKRVVDKLDGLGRLRWLIDVETDRLEALREREKAAIPFKFTDRTVQTLGVLLDMYMKWQVELGIVDSKPSEYNVNIKHGFEGIMEHTVQGNGNRMVDATHRFLEMAKQKALTLKRADDGSYSLGGSETHVASACKLEDEDGTEDSPS